MRSSSPAVRARDRESGTIETMVVLFAFVIAAVLFVVAMVALGRGDLLDRDTPAAAEALLPAGVVTPDNLFDLRFAVVQRGYRMDQVDTVLDRLAAELAARDERIVELESRIRD